MIKIIGTTHFMPKEEIEKIITNENPDVLGVELCKTRFKVLTNQEKNQSKEKDDSLLGEIADEIKKKAKEEKLDYGSDMKAVMFYAINNNIPLLFVDKDIIEIRREMSKIPQEEQIHLQKELVKFQNESLQTKVDENEVIERMKKEIPMAYKILVEGRDYYIRDKILEGIERYPNQKILIFLGKGHTKKIEELIK